MKISERAARERLREAMRHSGGQTAFCEFHDLPTPRWQVAISRSVSGPRPIRDELLMLIGLRRDEHGHIHEEHDPKRIAFRDKHARGELHVRAVCEILRDGLPAA